VTQILIRFFEFVLDFFVGLFPNQSAVQGFLNGADSLLGILRLVDMVFPVGIVFAVANVFLGFNVARFGIKLVVWVLRKIPFVGIG